MSSSNRSTPDARTAHCLRFARAIALVGAVALTPGCRAIGTAVGCQHCHCPWASFSVQQPVSCGLVGQEDDCCAPVEGPLPPPDLAV